MVSSKAIRVHESLINEFRRIGEPMAEKMKKQFGLKHITIDYPTISEMVAGRLAKKKNFNFSIRRVSRDRGVLSFF